MTSTTYDQTAFAHFTNEAVMCFLELDNADLASPIRVVNGKLDIVSNGNTYQGFPFFATKPSNIQGELPQASLTICNVDRQIVEAIRSISSPLSVTMFTTLLSTPNVIEDGPYSLILRDVGYNYFNVTGRLTIDDFRNEPFPADIFDPVVAPGLF